MTESESGGKLMEELRRGDRDRFCLPAHDSRRFGKAVGRVRLAGVPGILERPDDELVAVVRAIFKCREIKRSLDRRQRVIDRKHHDCLTVARQRRTHIRASRRGYLRFDPQRTIARQRRIKLLGIVSRRLVKPVIISLNAARAKAVDQVRPAGNLDQVAMPMD